MKAIPTGTDGNIIIPTTASGPQGPTGQVANTNTTAFLVNGGGDGNQIGFDPQFAQDAPDPLALQNTCGNQTTDKPRAKPDHTERGNVMARQVKKWTLK